VVPFFNLVKKRSPQVPGERRLGLEEYIFFIPEPTLCGLRRSWVDA